MLVRLLAISAAMVVSMSMIDATHAEEFLIRCPNSVSGNASLTLYGGLASAVPESAEEWSIKGTVAETIQPKWQAKRIDLPKDNASIVVCGIVLTGLELEASLRLPRTVCKIDVGENGFRCTGPDR